MEDLFTSGGNALLIAVKVSLWLFLLVYVVFAATIIKQIKIMTETITTGVEMYLKAAGLLHFLFALTVLTLAVVLL